MRPSPPIVVLRTMALVEAAEGAIALVMGFGRLSLLHRDVQAAAEWFLRFAHFDPASRYPRVFLSASGRITDGELVGAAAHARTMDGVGAAIDEYWTHPANRQWLRRSAGGDLSFRKPSQAVRHGEPVA